MVLGAGVGVVQQLEDESVAPQVAGGEPDRRCERQQLGGSFVGRLDLVAELELEQFDVEPLGPLEVAHAVAEVVEDGGHVSGSGVGSRR